MRFSLKWVLIGVTYVAVAAAAFSQETWVYADMLWLASLLAVVYAGLVAVFARGRRQAGAAGFVVASVCFLACVWLSHGDGVPTSRLLMAAGVGQNTMPTNVYAAQPTIISRPVTVTTNTPSGPKQSVKMVQEMTVAAVAPTPISMATPVPMPAQPWPAPAVRYSPPAYVDFSIYVRAGNAVGMLLLGGVGILLGLLAFKAARREAIGAERIAPGR